MSTKPDTIKITAAHKEEVSASRAELFVAVKGSSLVSGDAALKKAKEVNQLVEAMINFGLSPEAIQLMGVHIETASGALLKSSSATYRLKIKCEKLDQIAELLDIVSSQKNASLERIAWKYDDDAVRERALTLALEKAKIKAGKVASALGVTILGVYDLVETVYDDEMSFMQAVEFGAAKRGFAAATPASANLGMDIQHSKTINLSVDVWYRVGDFQNS
jgi:uncharacterized protein YggE